MRWVALLRGINVGGNRRVPMADLRGALTQAGFDDVRSYVQTGNLVLEAERLRADELEATIEKLIQKTFGFHVDVLVRNAGQWKRYSRGSPFRSAEKERPNLLLLGLCRGSCKKDLAEKLAGRATQGEKIKVVGDAIWVDFVKSVGNSRLTPAAFEHAAGAPVTMRNWNTVLKLREILEE